MSEYTVKERTSGRLTFTLADADGTPVKGSQLSTLTLTLYDIASRAYLNSRQGQDAKNTNDVTIDESGVVTWNWRVEDMTMHDTTKPRETHRAVFVFTWATGGCWHAVDFVVENEYAVA